MNTHTPGPWRLAESSKGWDIYGAGYFVGEVPDSTKTAENVANARLIAAAPELLRALIIAETCINNAGRWPGRRVVADAFLPTLRTAIAKATGAAS